MADEMTIQFEGQNHSIDDFELGDLEWLEEHLDAPLNAINPGSMKAIVGFVYLIKRREDPEFTLEDARRLKLEVFTGPDDAEDTERLGESPTGAAPASVKRRPAAKRKAAV